MTHSSWKSVLIGVLVAIAGAAMFLTAQQAAPDLILSNGKIITVDERFSIAQAVAIRGDRFVGPEEVLKVALADKDHVANDQQAPPVA